MSQASLKQSVADRLEEIRAEVGDTVAIDDIGEIVLSLMTTIEGDLGVADLRVHRELNELLEYIGRARQEIASIQPERIRAESIQVATDELDAVVEATEEATGKFLDAAETLESMAEGMNDEASVALNELATQIYEASNFQDITGQRINKVVAALRHIEERIEDLSRVMDGDAAPEKAAEPSGIESDTEDALLNGPAMPDQANSQEDIDALLASFD